MKLYVEMNDEEYEKYKQFLKSEFISEERFSKMDVTEFLLLHGYESKYSVENCDPACGKYATGYFRKDNVDVTVSISNFSRKE